MAAVWLRRRHDWFRVDPWVEPRSWSQTSVHQVVEFEDNDWRRCVRNEKSSVAPTSPKTGLEDGRMAGIQPRSSHAPAIQTTTQQRPNDEQTAERILYIVALALYLHCIVFVACIYTIFDRMWYVGVVINVVGSLRCGMFCRVLVLVVLEKVYGICMVLIVFHAEYVVDGYCRNATEAVLVGPHSLSV